MSSPTVTELRRAIAQKIVNVDGSIAVQHYERYTKLMSDLVAMYKSNADSPRLNGFYVRNVGTKEILVDSGRWSVWHRWRVRHVMSLDDADETEVLFDEQNEAIRDAFRDIESRAEDPLGALILGTIDPDSGEAGIQVLDSKPVMFAGVLCHWAELGLTTQHLLSQGE